MTPATDTTVRTSIVVNAPVERAFAVFTTEIGTWWPASHHLLEGDGVDMACDGREGGSIYDRRVDGAECHFARILTWEPPHRMVFTWDITPEWTLQTDLDKTSEVEVRFTEEAPGRTRVDLEHRNLEHHGDGWESMRASVAAEGGWRGVLQPFLDKLSTAS